MTADGPVVVSHPTCEHDSSEGGIVHYKKGKKTDRFCSFCYLQDMLTQTESLEEQEREEVRAIARANLKAYLDAIPKIFMVVDTKKKTTMKKKN